jgi:hypothetical protein
MIKRLLTLQIILVAALGSVFLLPKTPPIKDASILTELPNFLTLSGWSGQPFGKASEEERAILAKDTEFYRRDYHRQVSFTEQQHLAETAVKEGRQPMQYYAGLTDVLNASIVLSGKDLSNSIHALERCLTAQGFNIPRASTMVIPLRSSSEAVPHNLPVRRLVCERAEPESKRIMRSIAYYWFVGHDSVTSNHVRRGIKDFSDRLLRGYDQRWAYITVTAYLDSGYIYLNEPGAKEPQVAADSSGNKLLRRPLSEADADRLVEEFINDLGPEIIRVDNIKAWPKD